MLLVNCRVMASPRSFPNPLAGPYLERLAQLRKDAARLQAALHDPATLFVPVWRAHSFVLRTSTAISAQFVTGLDHLGISLTAEPILLGEFRGQLCFAVEIPEAQEPALQSVAEFCDLRSIAGELVHDEAGLLAYARAMVLWRERHRFCGRCGRPTQSIQGGHVLQCIDPACAHQQFPRIDPAVIVLITHGEQVLLGRQSAWPAGRYSTIAGFVEPGESLEDAVAREVYEETGVRVDSVQYHSSQPWPFPSSLMLGFTAHASDMQTRQIDDELEDVRWLTRAQIADGEVALPNPVSISFRLIEDWYDAGASVALCDEPAARLWTGTAKG
ncbi:MAG TPA: NAD(+) diphosphatase [Povalibacter sp.]